MLFKNREEAARLLADALKNYRGKNPLVLAIPRGAVPMAKIIAERLLGELDVVLVHKIGHPDNKEFAIGAIDEAGNISGNEELFSNDSYAKSEAHAQLLNLQARRKQYTPFRKRIDPHDRIVIIVDDGIATGWTIKAALKTLRSCKPKALIVAAAVSSPSSLAEIKLLADEVVCLNEPENFMAVGQFFQDFGQVSDEEVIKILQG